MSMWEKTRDRSLFRFDNTHILVHQTSLSDTTVSKDNDLIQTVSSGNNATALAPMQTEHCRDDSSVPSTRPSFVTP